MLSFSIPEGWLGQLRKVFEAFPHDRLREKNLSVPFVGFLWRQETEVSPCSI